MCSAVAAIKRNSLSSVSPSDFIIRISSERNPYFSSLEFIVEKYPIQAIVLLLILTLFCSMNKAVLDTSNFDPFLSEQTLWMKKKCCKKYKKGKACKKCPKKASCSLLLEMEKLSSTSIN